MQLLIDSSFLFKNHLEHPDLQKLLRRSKAGDLRICIPHIVWEEHRTQLLDVVFDQVNRLRAAVDAFAKPNRGNIVSGALRLPPLEVWSDDDLENISVATMDAFANDNRIELIPIEPDHAERAWRNYFRVGAPFKRAEKRENRRKDIPDSWILEAAIDLAKLNSGMVALCGDGKLSEALRGLGVQVLATAQEVLDLLDGAVVAPQRAQTPTVPLIPAQADQQLNAILSPKRNAFELQDRRVFGFISYLDAPSKDQLLELLSKAGMATDIAVNAAERLVLMGVVKDTGSHYLPIDRVAAELAASAVESEIISLMEQ